ncbi:heme NO-binding domain-containing protein [Pendulispora brunnea]|uniref:Heme NO-binding domain-containing protein n=1 Tax=Pendulispora brunnea TaxID=2905690 RepID=A0ABZ2KDA7_9BACT
MHGIIFLELKKYVGAKWGAPAWSTLLADAGLGSRSYLPVHEYPDDEAELLIGTVAKTTGQTFPTLLEDFGEFIVPDLLQVYRSLIHANWRTLDLIENTERMIHRIVRLRNPGARPPQLVTERRNPSQVAIHYRSTRRMCGIAKGMARGVAKHYGERVAIHEPQCMHTGAPECVIELRLAN